MLHVTPRLLVNAETPRCKRNQSNTLPTLMVPRREARCRTAAGPASDKLPNATPLSRRLIKRSSHSGNIEMSFTVEISHRLNTSSECGGSIHQRVPDVQKHHLSEKKPTLRFQSKPILLIPAASPCVGDLWDKRRHNFLSHSHRTRRQSQGLSDFLCVRSADWVMPLD